MKALIVRVDLFQAKKKRCLYFYYSAQECFRCRRIKGGTAGGVRKLEGWRVSGVTFIIFIML